MILVFIKNNGEPVCMGNRIWKNLFYNSSQVPIKSVSNPIDWPDAKELTDSYNSGDSNASARMYVVLNADMENAVWNGLNSMGLTGSQMECMPFGLDFTKI